MSHHPSSMIRTPSPVFSGQNMQRRPEGKIAVTASGASVGHVSSPVMRAGSTAGMIKPQGMRMMTPRSERDVEAGATLGSQPQAKAAVSSKPFAPPGGTRRSPVSGTRKSPVTLERPERGSSSDQRKQKQHRPLSQGSAVRSSSGTGLAFSGPGSIPTGGTPRGTPGQDMTVTPRAAWNPMVVMNPHYDGQKSLIQPGGSFKTPSALNTGASMGFSQLSDEHSYESPAAAGTPSGRPFRGFTSRDTTRMSVSGSPIMSMQEDSRLKTGATPGVHSSLDSALGARAGTGWQPVQENVPSISSAIILLQQNQLLHEDQVLKEMFQIFVNRLDSCRKRMQDPRDRVVLTSDSSTQVVTMDAESQTDLPEFQEKRLRPKGRGLKDRGHNCSYSDSDVPSEAPSDQTAEGLKASRSGHRRRTSLDEISLSTNSPRESCDGYSRDLSDASGPAGSITSSIVQMSVASSTDASQTTTMGRAGSESEYMAFAEGTRTKSSGPDRRKPTASAPRLKSGHVTETTASRTGKPQHGMGELNEDTQQQFQQLQGGLKGLSLHDNRPQQQQPQQDGLHDYMAQQQQQRQWTPSPIPSIETLMELQRILDEQYKKLVQQGAVGGPSPNSRSTRERGLGINSPATAEMRRLTMESALASSHPGEEGAAREGGGSRERPPNPDPTKWSPESRGATPGVYGVHGGGGLVPQSVRMGNSPPKHGAIKTPATHTRLSVPSLNLPRSRQDAPVVESPLSTPRSGSAFLAHVNSARSSTNSGSASSTPRTHRSSLQQGYAAAGGRMAHR